MKSKEVLKEEILSDEQLEFVVGGTRLETALANAAFYKYYFGEDVTFSIDNASDNLYQKEVLGELLDNWEIVHNIDVGLNGTGEGEKANEYFRNGKKLNNNQLLALINHMATQKT